MPTVQRLINPLTHECKLVSDTAEARKLRSYGWRPATLVEWFEYRHRQTQTTLFVHMQAGVDEWRH